MSSNIEERVRATLRVGVALLLLSPYLIWILQVPQWTWPAATEWMAALRNSFSQAGLSSVLAFIAGFYLFRALQSWRGSRWQSGAELALLLPNMVPALFLVMSFLSLAAPFGVLPYGFSAVVFAHVWLNAGLVAVAIDRLVHHKLGGLAETAWVLGASSRLFWRKVALPYIGGDLASVFLFVFSLCFTSFSIPLLLSGERVLTVEVAIFDAIRMEGSWDKAVLLAAFQSLMLFSLAILLPEPFWPRKPARAPLEFLVWCRGRHLVFVPALIVIVGWLKGLGSGLFMDMDMDMGVPARGVLIEALLTTAIVALSVGLFHVAFFLVTAFVSPHARLNRFLNGYLAPSPVITGFGLLLIPVDGDLINLGKLVLALSLISIPYLYRWIVHSALASVRGQVITARALGASWRSILVDVVWPQTASPLLRASGLAAVWAAGDFALSGILIGEAQTLPLVMESLLSRYRFEAAQLLMLPLVILCLLIYAIFMGAARYVSR
ncbi:MAG: ABC transporter permease [Bdellovibrionales bacterium]